MSKYIIDTKTWANLFEVQMVGVYGIGNDIVTDEKTVWSRMFRLDELEELNSDYINDNYGNLQEDAYKRGLEDGKKSGYEKGLNAVGTYRKGHAIGYEEGYEDGKKSIDKGCEGCRYVLKFANDDPCKNCSNCYTSKYAPMPKQDDPINVGDEVILASDSHAGHGKVLSIVNGICYIMWEDKTVSGYEISGVRRCTE